MQVYICTEKIRKENGVISNYILRNKYNNETISVSATELKQNIINGKVKVENLTLTSDFRLVDSAIDKYSNRGGIRDSQDNKKAKFTDKISKEYGQEPKGKLKYCMNKLKSPRVAKLVAVCLMLGISASTLTGCGTPTEACAVEQSEETSYESLYDLIENAQNIYLDAKHLKASSISIVVKDTEKGTEYGTIKDKVLRVPSFDGVCLLDSDENILVEAKERPGINYNTWNIYNNNSGVKYILDGKFSMVLDKYEILDENEEVLGYIKQDLALGKEYNIYNSDKEKVAVLIQDPLRSDMQLSFTDECNFDKENIVVIASCIKLNNRENAQRLSSSSKSSSK